MSAARNGLPWFPDEVHRLRELAASGKTSAEVAQILDRTRTGVKSKALSLGIVMGRRPAAHRTKAAHSAASATSFPLR